MYKRFVENQGKRCLHYDGEVVLLKMIMLSADGVAFIDKKDFLYKTEAPKATGNDVWNFCVENEILTMNEKGFYSAKEWVAQSGFLIGENRDSKERKETTKANRKITFVPHKVTPEVLGLSEEDMSEIRPIYRNGENILIAVHLFYDWMTSKKEAGTWNPKTNIKQQLLNKDRDWYKKALGLVTWNREEYLAQIKEVWGR
jgi:hypothetical protein